jgi:anti-sigma factor RsiW
MDNRLTEPEQLTVVRHLANCGECGALHRRTAELRRNLRSLAPVRAPNRLSVNLRILASRELLRSRQTAWQAWMDRVRLVMDNMMRPFAVPFAGGLASALFIFGTLMPSLGFLRTAANDRPTALYTEASIDNVADFATRSKSNDDTLIEVQVDGQGRMVDYFVPQGQMTSEIGNMLLFTTFTPATQFLRPTSGKVVIRLSRIVVKG